jgi:predicted lipoprotein with Yx(FWY)xxD motif
MVITILERLGKGGPLTMPHIVRIHRSPRSHWLAIAGLAGAATLGLAACGSSSSKTSATTVAPTTTTPAGITVKSASVTGVGTVLVNGQGLTLYLLTSEAGGKVTCTDENGCTKVWPDNELPAGVTAATAGAGIDATKLGTTKGASGDSYVTYAGFPLYTFSHDSGPGTANGEGIKSFGGTWEAITPAGTPVLPTASGAAATTTTAY